MKRGSKDLLRNVYFIQERFIEILNLAHIETSTHENMFSTELFYDQMPVLVCVNLILS